MKTHDFNHDAKAGFAPAPGSDASARDSRIAKPKEQWCLKGHSAICDRLCKLWSCKHEHQQALLAPRPNVPDQRPGE
jgi:hypothetical protein